MDLEGQVQSVALVMASLVSDWQVLDQNLKAGAEYCLLEPYRADAAGPR